MKRKMLLAAVFAVSMFLFTSASALAVSSADILYQETAMGGDLWQYDYIFYNTSTAGENLFSVWLDFDHMAEVTGSPLPTGWFGTVWETGPTQTLDASADLGYEITPGNNLGGFSFTVNYRAGNLPYTAYFDPGESPVMGTSAPIVPEPISAILFLSGGAAMAVRRRLMKKMK